MNTHSELLIPAASENTKKLTFENLHLDIHYSLASYLHVPDLISLSQTTTKLREIYIELAWETCVADKSDFQDESRLHAILNARIITSYAFHNGFNDPSSQKFKSQIKKLKIHHSLLPYIKRSEYPALQEIILSRQRVLETSNEYFDYYGKRISQNTFEMVSLSFDMLRFNHYVHLVTNDSMSLCYSFDLDTFKDNMFLRQGSFHLIVERQFSDLLNHIQVFDSQKFSPELSALTVNEITINEIPTPLLEHLLMSLTTFPKLSKVTFSVAIEKPFEDDFMNIWPPTQLINHDCFSRVKQFVLKPNDFHDKRQIPLFTIPCKTGIELKYVTAIEGKFCHTFPWPEFWLAISFSNLTHLQLELETILPVPYLPQLTSFKCTIKYMAFLLLFVDSVSCLVNLKTLTLNLHWMLEACDRFSFDNVMLERLKIAKMFIGKTFQTSSYYSSMLGEPEQEFISKNIDELQAVSLQYLENNKKYSNTSDSQQYISESDKFIYIRHKILPFYLELMLYRMSKLPLLSDFALSMYHYIDISQLHFMIRNQKTLKNVHINVRDSYESPYYTRYDNNRFLNKLKKTVFPDLGLTEMDSSYAELQKTLRNIADLAHYSIQIPKHLEPYDKSDLVLYECDVYIPIDLIRLRKLLDVSQDS